MSVKPFIDRRSLNNWATYVCAFFVGISLIVVQPPARAQETKTGTEMRLVFTSFHATAPADASIAGTVDPRLSTNLSQSTKLKVLERRRLEEALQALKIEASAIIDPSTAV